MSWLLLILLYVNLAVLEVLKKKLAEKIAFYSKRSSEINN